MLTWTWVRDRFSMASQMKSLTLGRRLSTAMIEGVAWVWLEILKKYKCNYPIKYFRPMMYIHVRVHMSSIIENSTAGWTGLSASYCIGYHLKLKTRSILSQSVGNWLPWRWQSYSLWTTTLYGYVHPRDRLGWSWWSIVSCTSLVT